MMKFCMCIFFFYFLGFYIDKELCVVMYIIGLCIYVWWNKFKKVVVIVMVKNYWNLS